MTLTQLKTLSTTKYTQSTSLILEEIEELIDDYNNYEESYAKYWLHENENCFEEGINEDDLNEMKGQCLEEYCNNEHYRTLYLKDQIINYMKRHLPEDSKTMIEFHKRVNGYESTSEVIYLYLRHKMDKEGL